MIICFVIKNCELFTDVFNYTGELHSQISKNFAFIIQLSKLARFSFCLFFGLTRKYLHFKNIHTKEAKKVLNHFSLRTKINKTKFTQISRSSLVFSKQFCTKLYFFTTFFLNSSAHWATNYIKLIKKHGLCRIFSPVCNGDAVVQISMHFESISFLFLEFFFTAAFTLTIERVFFQIEF